MADIGTVYVKVAPNMQGIQSKINAGFKGAGAEATKMLGDEVDSNSGGFQKAIGKLGGIAGAGGKAIAAGLGVGIVGLTALTGKMLNAGAELEQQLGGAEAVFGQFAENIKDSATTAYFQAGLSQNEFLQGANKMGSLFQGAGFSVEQSMKMTQDAMQRASDVASIMGIDTTAALEAVTGMAKGNFTMMDNLGVAMNDTALGAYALSKGIKESTTEMSIQQKVGLAQQLFLEKTAKYAGNYQKENQSLAGSLNSTKKAFQDLLSGQGEIDGFMELLVNTVEIAAKQVGQILPKIVQAVGVILPGIVNALAKELPNIVPALISAVTGLMQALVDALPIVIKVLVGALPSFIDAFIQIFLGVVKALPEIVKVLTDAIPEIVDALVEGLTSPESLTEIIIGGVLLFMALVEAIPVVIVALVKAVPEIITNIVGALTSSRMLSAIQTAGTKLFTPLSTAFGKVSEYLSGEYAKFTGMVTKAFEAAVGALNSAKDTVVSLANSGLNALNAALQATLGWLKENQVWLTNTAIVIGSLLLPKIIALGIEALKAAAQIAVSVAQMVASWAVAAAQATVSAATAAAAWVAGAARSLAAWVATIPSMIAGFVQASAAAVVNAAIAVGSWVAGAAQTIASWAVAFASYLAGVAVAAAQTLLAGARMAAGWLLALGPIGLIIAAVAAAAGLIIYNWDKVRGAFLAVWNYVTGLWDKAGSFFSDIGKNLVQGLWNGINNMSDWIVSKIKGFSDNILKGIKSFFGIHSPSTVFAGIGTDLNRGLAKGIESSAGLVSNSVDAMSNQALAALGSTDIAATYGVGGIPTATAGGNTSNQNTFTGQIVLGDATAVKEFFQQINQDAISASMGITPAQGATA